MFHFDNISSKIINFNCCYDDDKNFNFFFIERLKFFITKENILMKNNLSFCDYFKDTIHTPIIKYKTYVFIDNNKFISDNIKNTLLNDFFFKLQKTYFALIKFVNIVFLKIKKPINNIDLSLNNINIYDKNVIYIIENNQIYLFKCSELIVLINLSLSTIDPDDDEYFIPLPIKNPYTSLIISKKNLYNIYFQLREKNYFNELLYSNFRCNFDMNIFHSFYSDNIVLSGLNRVLKINNKNYLKKKILQMIDYYNDEYVKSPINIPNGFPSYILIDAFKKYIKEYLYNKIIFNNPSCVLSKLLKFQNMNPKFGRKYIKTDINRFSISSDKNKQKWKYIYHIDFNYSNNNNNFIMSHTVNLIESNNTRVSEEDDNNENVTEESDDQDEEDNVVVDDVDNVDDVDHFYDEHLEIMMRMTMFASHNDCGSSDDQDKEEE